MSTSVSHRPMENNVLHDDRYDKHEMIGLQNDDQIMQQISSLIGEHQVEQLIPHVDNSTLEDRRISVMHKLPVANPASAPGSCAVTAPSQVPVFTSNTPIPPPTTENLNQEAADKNNCSLGEFAYDQYLPAKQMYFSEFMYATLMWGANTASYQTTVGDLQAYLVHLAAVCKMADGCHAIQAHVAYDNAVRVEAKRHGWSAFKVAHPDLKARYYGKENQNLPVKSGKAISQKSSKLARPKRKVKALSDSTEPNVHLTEVEPAQSELPSSDKEHTENDHSDTSIYSKLMRETTEEVESEVEDALSDLNVPHLKPAVRLTSPRQVKHRKPAKAKQKRQATEPRNSAPEKDAVPIRLICSYCGKEFKKRTNLKYHEMTHTGQKSHFCKICDKGFVGSGGLQRHMATHGDERTKLCSYCGKAFKHANNLQRHLLMHTGQRPFQCKFCDKKCNQRANLRIHMMTHKAENSHVCGTCHRGFAYAYQLKTHMLRHSGELTFPCAECGVRFIDPPALKRHTIKVHGDGIATASGKKSAQRAKNHVCSVCDKRYAAKTHLTQHMRTHTGEKPFTCEQCGKRFAYKQGLESHQRTHTGAKPFPCSFCGQRFATDTNMRRHVKHIHTGVKNHVCTYCGKAFVQKSGLLVHVMRHEGDKRHKCETCGMAFVEAGSLRKHLVTHTGQRATHTRLL